MSIGNISNLQSYFAYAGMQNQTSSFCNYQPNFMQNNFYGYQPNSMQNNSLMNMFGVLQNMFSLFSMFNMLNMSTQAPIDDTASDSSTNVSSNVSNLLVNVNAPSLPTTKQLAIDTQNTTEFLQLDDDIDNNISREELAAYMGINTEELDKAANSYPPEYLKIFKDNCQDASNAGNIMLDELYAEIDSSHNGKIDKQEFINYVDSDGDGLIEEKEVENFDKDMALEVVNINNGSFVALLEKYYGEGNAQAALKDNYATMNDSLPYNFINIRRYYENWMSIHQARQSYKSDMEAYEEKYEN